jgi:hypothetical protein
VARLDVAWRMATEGAVFVGSLVLLSSSPFFFLFESEFCPEVPSFPGFFCGIEAREGDADYYIYLAQ